MYNLSASGGSIQWAHDFLIIEKKKTTQLCI